jgi:hypothetical protein
MVSGVLNNQSRRDVMLVCSLQVHSGLIRRTPDGDAPQLVNDALLVPFQTFCCLGVPELHLLAFWLGRGLQ